MSSAIAKSLDKSSGVEWSGLAMGWGGVEWGWGGVGWGLGMFNMPCSVWAEVE